MRFLRIGICALIAIGVLAHGGVEDWARAIFETGAALLFLGWVIRVYLGKEETAEISPLLPPLAGLLVVVLVQMVFRRTASMYDTRQSSRCCWRMCWWCFWRCRRIERWRSGEDLYGS